MVPVPLPGRLGGLVAEVTARPVREHARGTKVGLADQMLDQPVSGVGASTSEIGFFPCSRPSHLVAASPRFTVFSVNLPSFRSTRSVFILRPRT